MYGGFAHGYLAKLRQHPKHHPQRSGHHYGWNDCFSPLLPAPAPVLMHSVHQGAFLLVFDFYGPRLISPRCNISLCSRALLHRSAFWQSLVTLCTKQAGPSAIARSSLRALLSTVPCSLGRFSRVSNDPCHPQLFTDWSSFVDLNGVLGNYATLGLNIADFARYANKPSAVNVQAIIIPIIFSEFSIAPLQIHPAHHLVRQRSLGCLASSLRHPRSRYTAKSYGIRSTSSLIGWTQDLIRVELPPPLLLLD